jgi:hypothetical protein
MARYNRIICWVSKTHKKLMEKAFPEGILFVNSVNEIDQKENDVVVISVEKITSMEIAKKIKKLKDPYFLEKKGIWYYNMIFAMEDSKYHFMIANCEINSNLFDS